jgi:hypothetical protein
MRVKHLILPGIILLLSTTLSKNVSARPLDEFEKVVDNQLQGVIQKEIGSGYHLVFPQSVGRLAGEAEAPFTLLLNANEEYQFAAVCDQDCNDVDLILKDENGNEVKSDIALNDAPVISFTPPTEAKYKVIVKMHDCADPSYCNFAMGVFTK